MTNLQHIDIIYFKKYDFTIACVNFLSSVIILIYQLSCNFKYENLNCRVTNFAIKILRIFSEQKTIYLFLQ